MSAAALTLDSLERIIAAPDERHTAEAALAAFREILPGEFHSAIALHPGLDTCEIFYPDQGWLAPTNPMVHIIAKTHSRHPLMKRFYADGQSAVYCRSQLVSDRVWKRSELYAVEQQLGFEDGSVLCQNLPSGKVLIMSCGRTRHFAAEDMKPARAFQRILNVLPPFRPAAAYDTKHYIKLGGLTVREREILHWVREGKRNSEIAIILGISPHTVRHHLEKIYPKIGVETRTAAALIQIL